MPRACVTGESSSQGVVRAFWPLALSFKSTAGTFCEFGQILRAKGRVLGPKGQGATGVAYLSQP